MKENAESRMIFIGGLVVAAVYVTYVAWVAAPVLPVRSGDRWMVPGVIVFTFAACAFVGWVRADLIELGDPPRVGLPTMATTTLSAALAWVCIVRVAGFYGPFVIGATLLTVFGTRLVYQLPRYLMQLHHLRRKRHGLTA